MMNNWKTWEDWALGAEPAQKLKVSYENAELKAYEVFCELENTEQSVHWHPEGNVWKHTLYVIEAADDIANREKLAKNERIVLILAAMCHDLGKPETTKNEDGRIKSHGHDQLGGKITEKFLMSIDCPELFRLKIVALVKEHLVYSSFQTVTERAVKRLEKRLEPASLDELTLLVEADHSGRPPLPKKLPEIMNEIREISERIKSR